MDTKQELNRLSAEDELMMAGASLELRRALTSETVSSLSQLEAEESLERHITDESDEITTAPEEEFYKPRCELLLQVVGRDE